MAQGSGQSLHSFDLAQTGSWDFLAGVDEAGRGAWAGPVVAGAVLVSREFYQSRAGRASIGFVNDSKQLSPGARERAFEEINQLCASGAIWGASGCASVDEIAENNILGATGLAMQRAVEGLLGEYGRGEVAFLADGDGLLARSTPGAPTVRLLIDGRPLKRFPYLHTGVIKGDGLSLAIAMASIVAKVTRDRMMQELDCEYPTFGFSRHKGYGTAAHLRALRNEGPCPVHRLGFLRKL